ncbi:MAG: DDE-type integrase/transposase/recombinase, partial [Deltaproteobacteria bacterium]|nr:DDE-type integrase/transposase/recombinase [Deltaproteobacteria bacterium]
RRQLPARSVNTLIRILELNGRVEKGEIRRSTLQDQLTARGYGGAQMRIYADQKDTIGAMRFQHPVRNSLWQSDFKDGPFIDGKPTFFIAFIDDCSRYIVHGEFCHGHNKEIVMASLYRAIQKYGTPKALYFDRGGEFRSRAISRTCSSLNIRVRYTKPRSPASKGKIERYNRTIESFIIESKLGDVKNLEHFNVLFKAWLEECYHSVGHAGLGDGRSPSEAFHGDKEPLRLMDPEFFRKAFLVVEENRRVDKSGCVSFGRGKHVIEGGTGMIGRKVSVVYHCVAPQDVWVEHGGFPPRKATPLAIGEWAARRPGPPPFAEPPVADGSMLLDGALRAHGERDGDPPGQAGRGEGAGPAPDPDPGPAASAAEDAHGGPGPRTGPDPGGQAHASMLLSAAVRESERRGQRSRAAISFKDMLKKKER